MCTSYSGDVGGQSRSRDFLSLQLQIHLRKYAYDPYVRTRCDRETGMDGRIIQVRHARRTIYINKQLGTPRIRMSLNGPVGDIFQFSRTCLTAAAAAADAESVCASNKVFVCVKFKMAVKTINIQFAILSRLQCCVGRARRGRNA